jgi:pentatricopeptide repeat protein
VSVASLNVILSACAGIGDVDRAFATLEDFKRYKLVPNVDTYSYALEALTRSIDPEFERDSKRRKEKASACREAAESILAEMAEKGLSPCHHCIEEFTLLLLNIGQDIAATEFVLERMDEGLHVGNKTILILSSKLADLGEFKMARLVASRISEPMPFIESRLERWKAEERRAQAEGTAPINAVDGDTTEHSG